MNRTLILTAALFTAPLLHAADPLTLELPGGDGPGKGRHVVLLSGDEEYRSEEALPMLAGILSKHHGFKCTVLFSVGDDGTINPNNQKSVTGSAALDSADAIIMALRFRGWPDSDLKHFVDAYNRGVPIIGLRTSTHAFDIKGDSAYKWLSWGNKGGFGKQVLGETWVSHWGHHGPEGTRGVIEAANKDHAILRGVKDVLGDTDVYEAAPPADAVILMRGEVIKGVTADSPPADYKKKTRAGKEQGVNDPMMPVAWTREHRNEAGTTNRVLCTTMGAATDLKSEGLRRLLVNGVYWGLKMDVPACADVTCTGQYQPTKFAGGGYRKGVKPADTALKP